jgi:hypothetical protein
MKRLILSLVALAGFGLFALPATAVGPCEFGRADIVQGGLRCNQAASVVVPVGGDFIRPGGTPGLGEPEGDFRSRYSVEFADGHQMTVIGGGYGVAAACGPAARAICPTPAGVRAPVLPCEPARHPDVCRPLGRWGRG